MKTKLFLPAFVLSFCFSTAFGTSGPSLSDLKGSDVVSGATVTPELKDRKGVVAVFLSAVCPCSNSHIEELSALAKENPDYSFVGIHSNTDEKKEATQAYFSEAKLSFPVIQDNGAKLADVFAAYKTPHAFVMNTDGKILYRGGVSNSHTLANADQKFLREALDDLRHGAVKKSEGRTLGCIISREGKNVW